MTKNESGTSALLKSINDEAIKSGENVKETMNKLSKALDKGREVGIQEALYRILGLKMTRFSEVVRFVNTNHPDHRDGLLKGNLESLEENDEIFHNSLHSYYQDRPVNSNDDETDWDNMELAEFVSAYNIDRKTIT